MYQVSGRLLPALGQAGAAPELLQPENLVDIRLGYDRTELAVNDTVNVKVNVSLNRRATPSRR